MKKNECLRCGHKWIPRIEGKPKSCPSCKNRLWDEVREKKAEEYPPIHLGFRKLRD